MVSVVNFRESAKPKHLSSKCYWPINVTAMRYGGRKDVQLNDVHVDNFKSAHWQSSQNV